MKKIIGFNLIELLLVLAIISILSAFSIPLYSAYLIKEKRLEATMTLSKLAVAFEQYYTIHNTYQNATLEMLGFPEKIADNRYQLFITMATDTNFKIQADPLGDQAKKDKLCAALTLNSQGEKGITGTGKLLDCWS